MVEIFRALLYVFLFVATFYAFVQVVNFLIVWTCDHRYMYSSLAVRGDRRYYRYCIRCKKTESVTKAEYLVREFKRSYMMKH